MLDSFSSNNWAYLLFQLTIVLKKDDIDPEKIQHAEYFYAGGLVEYVKWLNADKVCLSFPFLFRIYWIKCLLLKNLELSIKIHG